MIECLQFYLKKGLQEYERINLNKKMLIEMTSEEFVELMDEIELDKKYDKKVLFEKFIDIYPDYKVKFHQKTFTRWIKDYAKLKDLQYEDRNSGSSKGFIITKLQTA